MASKRRGGVGLYVALVIALIIFVPAVQEVVLDGLVSLLEAVRELNPFR